ncbi:NAD(+)/NADH kinase [uncultured Cardiobacterium sp.]|uniref:NAD(+)/NADH kinase n=1 Tax=uncultured Cardiobacterium sp. TaxID=417619 RepID=UPI0026364B35|nr:NAD(+)/NADH kinase [uncultured Cardiobacterium sp.]
MTSHFKHIGIVGKYGAVRVDDTIARVIAILDAHGLACTLDRDTAPPQYRDSPAALPIAAWGDVDLCIVVGGDGTFLYAGRALITRQIPLLGIHTGRLGFLADLTLNDLPDRLDRILGGEYHREERHTLHVTVATRDGSHAHTAINDAVIHSSKARMIELDVYTHARHLSHYRADGLIIATPTGSTAYALAAGGPIIEPNLPVNLVVPICPHTLTQRPVVIDAASPITIAPCGSGAHLSIDGQQQHRLHPKDRITIRPGTPLPVLHPADYHFQDRLRAKLNWGIAPEDNK